VERADVTTERSETTDDELQLTLLVLRCQVGDDRAFGRLHDWFSRRTLGYLSGLIGEDAEDVQQEVWLGVYRSIQGLSDPRAFRTWLFRTTRHRAIDFLRRRKRERELLMDAALEANDADRGVEDQSGESWDDAELAAALAQLPTPQREVLLLRYQNEMSYAEIALVVGCPIGTVRSRLYEAKRRMQELIEQRR
jgi:RNA polymerase sigma-70 factor (ECF subfamily)